MAKQTGGPLGRTSGKIAGIVFGAARSRTGKVVTIREKVTPANPNTADQQAQRNIFKNALSRVRLVGPDIYQDDFNRAVGQLPGFQSLMSTLLNNVDATPEFTVPADIPLGDLHFPGTVTLADGAAAGTLKYTWSTEAGSNGTANDEAVIIAYKVEMSIVKVCVISDGVKVRSEGVAGESFANLDPAKDYICMILFRGAGTADGKLSKASSEERTAPV